MGSHATAAPTEFANLPITIRLATKNDDLSLARLAALDSTEEVPAGHVLLGEVGGNLRAALSLSDGSAIADPFHPTADLLKLLRAHARRVRSPRSNGWLRLQYVTS
jgi:hypothetical protein